MALLLKPGDICGDHEIVGYLGTGSTSEVYQARNPKREPRALKLITAVGQAHLDVQQRFAQEGRALASIAHANVMRFFGAGAWEGRLYLLFEVVRGQSLRARTAVPEEKRPSVEEILFWFLQACEGVAAAHAVGVLHRDLSPDNILVVDDSDVVKVIDFGKARVRDFGVPTTPQAQARASSGMYCAPEPRVPTGPDPRTEVYALGMIGYEALSGGRHPLGDMHRCTVPERVMRHLAVTPAPLAELAPWVPHDVAAVLHRAMAKDPAERYATVRLFIQALNEPLQAVRGPLRRAADNAPDAPRPPVFERTSPMPVYDADADPPPAVAGVGWPDWLPRSSPAPDASVPGSAMPGAPQVDPAAPSDREAWVPAQPPVGAPRVESSPWGPTLKSAQPVEEPRLPAPVAVEALRSTDAPTEREARRSVFTGNRALGFAAVGVAVALTLAGVVVTAGSIAARLGPTEGTGPAAPHPAASTPVPALPPAPAPSPSPTTAPAPSVAASAAAPPVKLPARPAATTAQPPPSHAPPTPGRAAPKLR